MPGRPQPKREPDPAVIAGRPGRPDNMFVVPGPSDRDDSDDIERDVVELTIPANVRFLGAARLVAASLATDLDFSVDDIDSLRIAVDEALTVFIEHHPDATAVRVTFELQPDAPGRAGRLRIQGRVVGPIAVGSAPRPDALVRRILYAVTESFEFGESEFGLVLSSSDAPPPVAPPPSPPS